MADEGTTVAAYVPWRTFKNTMDRLSQGLPNRIDKSVFKGQSGSTQTQLLAGLKFLGLIGEDLVPTAALRSLADKNELERKEDLVQIFRTCYSKLFDLDLTKATQQQLEQEMTASYGVNGSTLRKATRFFLVGASDLGIPLSKFLATAKAAGNGETPHRRAPRRRQRVSAGEQENHRGYAAPAGGTSKSITLRRGETLTLAATADFFAMDPNDRKFVFKLIEELEGYEAKAGKASDIPPGQSQADEGGEE